MQSIKELALLLRENNLRPVNVAGQPIDGHSKIGAFFDGLISGSIESDSDAAHFLYNEGEEAAKYRKIKSDFRNRLLDALCHLNVSADSYTDYQRAYYDSYKQFFFVKILSGQNANNAALYVASKLLKQAIRFEFVALCMEVCSFLRIQYALRETTDKKYAEANLLFNYYHDLYHAECLVEERYSLLVARHINSHAPKSNSIETVDQYYKEICGYLEKYDTYHLHLYGRLINLFRYLFASDYAGAVQVCNDAIEFFLAKPFEARAPLQIFYYQKLICNIYLRQFDEGKKTACRCMQYLKEGSFNWFKYRELYLKLLMHTGQYQLASEFTFATLEHPKFEFLPENVKEIWRIFEAYICFLAALQKVELPKGKDRKFKLVKFINETPIYARDKAGLNIAILIAKIIYHILDKKLAQLVDEAESIEQYCYRYLNTPQTQRSFLFIKMLLQVPANWFSLEEIDKKNQKLLDTLKNFEINIAHQSNEIEIIPYENLWQMVRGTLSLRERKHLNNA